MKTGRANAQQTWAAELAEATFQLDHDTLQLAGVQFVSDSPRQGFTDEDVVAALAGNIPALVETGDATGPRIASGHLALQDGVTLVGPSGGVSVVDLLLTDPGHDDPFDARQSLDRAVAPPALYIDEAKYRVDTEGARLTIVAAGLRMNRALAESIGVPGAAGIDIGDVRIDAELVFLAGTTVPDAAPAGYPLSKVGNLPGSLPQRPAPGSPAGLEAGSTGPDMTFCRLFGLAQFGRVGSVVGLALATTSWNVGTEPLVWYQNPDERHPFIVGNLYRMRDDRFEQIGQSWVKHGFCALDLAQCATECTGTGCTTLGVGCTDTYGAALNANPSFLGPRYEINPWTGAYTYEGSHLSMPHSHNAIEHRLQVHDDDLDPALNEGATYLAEGYYVCLDDVNVMNSMSHKPVSITGSPGGQWTFGMSGPSTAPEIGPAIFAWEGATFTTLAQELPVREFVSPDGRCILGSKAIDLGEGRWRYEYALLNVDMDRKVGAFTVPVDPLMQPENVEFHFVRSHDEPYANSEWAVTVVGGAVRWSTTDNPLRWGTLYNFRFEVAAPPVEATVAIGLYEPGSPGIITGTAVGPRPVAPDCDGDGVSNACEFDCSAEVDCPEGCGTIPDCNRNRVPDNCEPDCNENGVPDDCDILAGTSPDCDGNTVPDECDPDGDADGVPDVCDTCPGGDDRMDADGDGRPDACDPCPISSDVTATFEPFDRDPGWTTIDEPGLTNGSWEWGVPAGGGFRWDPPTDASGDGACMLTANFFGSSDVNGGTTRLLSPAYDLSSGGFTCTYAYWFGTSSAGTDDSLVVEASNDNGTTWTLLAVYDRNNKAWGVEEINLDEALELTGQVRFRFSATDGGGPTIVECAIDDFRLTTCAQPCRRSADCDDRNPCTVDACERNECTHAPVDCSDLDSICSIGVCNEATGRCRALPANVGDACDDQRACTESDICTLNGTCRGTPVDCSHLDEPCRTGQCDAATGACVAVDTGYGHPCDDLDPCTYADRCDGFGTCRGSAVDCTELDGACVVGVCEPGSGDCVTAWLHDGVRCEDGLPCTYDDSCMGGSCMAGSPDYCGAPPAPRQHGPVANRYLTFVPGALAEAPIVQALRVTSPDDPDWVRWVDRPDDKKVARLGCEPVYRDWEKATIHVADVDVGPGRSFVVQGIRDVADPDDLDAWSLPAIVPTAATWGDVNGDGSADDDDVAAVLLGFRDPEAALPRSVLDLGGRRPDGAVTFEDLQLAILAAAGNPYPFIHPSTCP